MTGLRYLFRVLAGAASGIAILLLVSGCSQFTYVPVRGKVFLRNKQPVSIGSVVFVPAKDNPLKATAMGKINSDGTYELSTEGRSGVPIGSYIACVRGPMRKVDGKEPPPLPYSMSYFDANDSPLKIEVVANPAPGAYDLELAGANEPVNTPAQQPGQRRTRDRDP
jgi:hypothetical protein